MRKTWDAMLFYLAELVTISLKREMKKWEIAGEWVF